MDWKDVILVLVAASLLSGSSAAPPSADPAPRHRLTLSERLEQMPETGNRRAPIQWSKGDEYTHTATIPLRVAREMLGEDGWQRCLDVSDDGRLRTACGVRNDCMQVLVNSLGIARLTVHPRACNSRRFYDVNEVPGGEPWPEPESAVCRHDIIDGVRWLVCFDDEAAAARFRPVSER
ncbi:MAG: hypothetical protein H6737_24860 [Alphaproteobacteria bacterium]|nr:hypothetical protein [Alphaproteobacteria bacterium]